MATPAPCTFQLGVVPCSTHTIVQVVDEVRQLLSDRSLSPRTILCVNAHIYNLAVGDPQLRQDLREARSVVADGMSIVLAGWLFGATCRARCNMTEAFRAFVTAADIPSSRAILAGMTWHEANAAAAEIERTSPHCRVTETYSGFLSDSEYLAVFAQHRSVDIIFLGLSTPRTERVAKLAAAACPGAIIWGIGAGTIKIYAGSMKEAPIVWRRLGLQWLHRFALDPRVLWRRYLIGNPLFIGRILTAWWRRDTSHS